MATTDITDLIVGSNALMGKPMAARVYASDAPLKPAATDAANLVWVCGGSTDQTQINAAITGVNGAGGGIVKLIGPTFTCSAQITQLSNVILSGQGRNTTTINFTASARIMGGSISNWGVTDLKITGKGGIIAEPYSDQSGIRIERVICTVSEDHSAAVMFYPTNCTLSDIQVIDYRAIDCNCSGLAFNGTGATKKIRNVVIDRCSAINCGIAARVNEFHCGFELSYANDLEEVLISNCYAENNWECGFYEEVTPSKNNVVFSNCVSINNGVTKGTAVYGAGFNVSGDTTLTGCRTSGNAVAGYKLGTGASAVGCSDNASYHNLYINEANNVYVNDIVGSNATAEGIKLTNSYNLDIQGKFINPVGGAQASHVIGGNGYPIYNSKLNIDFQGGTKTPLALVYAYNTEITGSAILSTASGFGYYVSDGYNINIHNLVMYCSGTIRGIHITSQFAKPNTVWLSDISIVDTQATPTLVYGIYYDGAGPYPILTNVSVPYCLTAASYHCAVKSAGQISSGEQRSESVPLIAGATGGSNDKATYWENPYSSAILIDHAMIYRTTKSSGASNGDFGVVASVLVEDCEDTWNEACVTQSKLTDHTGTLTESGVYLVTGENTLHITGAGTFTITLPAGTTGTAVSGTATLSGSPVTLVNGNDIDSGATTGTIIVTVAITSPPTITLDTTDFKVGAGSVKIVTTAATANGDTIASEATTGTLDLSSHSGIAFWIKSSVDMAAADLTLMVNEGNNGTVGSVDTYQNISVPALKARVWKRCIVDYSTDGVADPPNATDRNAIKSVSLKYTANAKVATINIDDVRSIPTATNMGNNLALGAAEGIYDSRSTTLVSQVCNGQGASTGFVTLWPSADTTGMVGTMYIEYLGS